MVDTEKGFKQDDEKVKRALEYKGIDDILIWEWIITSDSYLKRSTYEFDIDFQWLGSNRQDLSFWEE